jgi:hypothetical protein
MEVILREDVPNLGAPATSSRSSPALLATTCCRADSPYWRIDAMCGCWTMRSDGPSKSASVISALPSR